MKRILIAALIAAGPAFADSIVKQGDDWIRITGRPCSDPNVLRHIPDSGHQLDFRAARARLGGAEYSACWLPIPGGVGIVYEDGDMGTIPESMLKPVPEA